MDNYAVPEQVYALIEEYNVLRRLCLGNAGNWLRPGDIQWLEARLATIRSALGNVGYVRYLEGN
jgi:hypothetical protein